MITLKQNNHEKAMELRQLQSKVDVMNKNGEYYIAELQSLSEEIDQLQIDIKRNNDRVIDIQNQFNTLF